MDLTEKHISDIKGWLMTVARSIRADGEECAQQLLLLNSTPSGEIGNLTAVDISRMDKDQWVSLQFKHSRDPSILVAILVNEGWSSFIPPGAPMPTLPASQCANRQEVLLISLLTKTEQFLLTADIHGKTIDDADFVKVEAGVNYKGRFIRESTP